jgi:hypothetical protein
MATVEYHPLLTKVIGRTEGLVMKTYKGKSYYSKRPDFSKRKLTEKQLEQNGKFRAASHYAKTALKNPELYDLYAIVARKKRIPVAGAATADYLNPPKIYFVDLRNYRGNAGDSILVHAEDDAETIRVEVAIRNSNNELMEEGVATKGAAWIYTCTTTLPETGVYALEVVAVDRPGNRTLRVEAL